MPYAINRLTRRPVLGWHEDWLPGITVVSVPVQPRPVGNVYFGELMVEIGRAGSVSHTDLHNFAFFDLRQQDQRQHGRADEADQYKPFGVTQNGGLGRNGSFQRPRRHPLRIH